MKPGAYPVLGVLQNQWFWEPDRVRAMLAAEPDPARRGKLRSRLIAYALFAGCKSGRVLKATLGDAWCQRITWDEASPQIGGQASDAFPADLEHLRAVLARVLPEVIITFGNVARDGIYQSVVATDLQVVLTAPHPAARGGDVVHRLKTVRRTLDDL